jgi:hypothetical protein
LGIDVSPRAPELTTNHIGEIVDRVVSKLKPPDPPAEAKPDPVETPAKDHLRSALEGYTSKLVPGAADALARSWSDLSGKTPDEIAAQVEQRLDSGYFDKFLREPPERKGTNRHMSQSTEADIKTVLSPYQFASDRAREQFLALNPDLAEVSPALLGDAVRNRLAENAHFLASARPQSLPGSLDEIERRFFERGNAAPGLLAGTTSGLTTRAMPGAGAPLGPPVPTLDAFEAAYAQRQAAAAATGIGLGGQHRPKPAK